MLQLAERWQRDVRSIMRDIKAGNLVAHRFGKSVQPREWFMVPLPVIDELVDRIVDGSITELEYDPASASLKQRA